MASEAEVEAVGAAMGVAEEVERSTMVREREEREEHEREPRSNESAERLENAENAAADNAAAENAAAEHPHDEIAAEQMDAIWPAVCERTKELLAKDPVNIKLKTLRHALFTEFGKHIIKPLMTRIRDFTIAYLNSLTDVPTSDDAAPSTDNASANDAEEDAVEHDDSRSERQDQPKRKRLNKSRADSGDEYDASKDEAASSRRRAGASRTRSSSAAAADDDDDDDAGDDHLVDELDSGQDEQEEEVESDYDDRGSKRRRIPKKSTTRGSKKRERVPGAPTRPRTSFLLFSIDQRPKLRRDEPDLSISESMKAIAEMWNRLSAKERAAYDEAAREDRQRWENEMQQFKQTDPDGYEREMQGLGKRKRSAQSGTERPKKMRKKDGDEVQIDDDDESSESKPTTRFQEIMQALKSTNRPRKTDVDHEELAAEAQALINTMKTAYLKDEDLMLDEKPAFGKFNLLPEVLSALNNKLLCEKLLELRVLRVIKDWLSPNPDDSLPNVQLRTSLYKALGTIPVHADYLKQSDGLAKLLTQMCTHPDETADNKRMLALMLQRWWRQLSGDSGVPQTGNVGRREAEVIAQRRQALVQMNAQATVHSTLPQPAVFDYAIRPKSQLPTMMDDDGGDGAGSGRGGGGGEGGSSSSSKTSETLSFIRRLSKVKGGGRGRR